MRNAFACLAIGFMLLMCTSAANAQVINACAKTNGGDLRIVAGPADCGNNEYPLSWNVQGPPGIQGGTGPAGPAGAGTPTYAFVGFSQGTEEGYMGIGSLHQLCAATFENSRMCTSAEIIQSPSWPTQLTSGPGWVQPVNPPSDNLSPEAGLVDVSGFYLTAGLSLNCHAWSQDVNFGLSVDSMGIYSGTNCSIDQPAACCAPID